MLEYLMIGVVLKPQGIRGECKIKSYAADPERFREWKTLYLKDGEAFTPLPVRIHRIQDGFIYAFLGSCATPEDAEKLRGRELYIHRSQTAPQEEGETLIADLLGCEAVDEQGNLIGTLTDVLQHGAVDTWVFRTPDGGTLMAPALLAVFPEVNAAEKRIRTVAERLAEVAVTEGTEL